ncbi:methyl-accepting chemotaxis protein [Pseudoalteromonas aurantia]|uniref:Methyl-accepting chemotaxis protein n=1 Tax=Pseudoalteromonas aurantia TaxID=43654 RepID=A0ABY2W1F1_9GAMM|nr:methyl-accepting chemotaxis protein [Pseudoalteromonas aurantia]TMO64463.1 methyl-accepting chemotaxis protein [Pseudoalteromonas aurantia]TMO77738.1 methyl-accepting chemotaxis protein [Pseudoalteromonas aurantia]
MQFLRRFTIFQRLMMLLMVVVLGLVLLSITNLTQQYATLEKQQYEKTKNLVETAHSLLTLYHTQYLEGVLPEVVAKHAALTAIKGLKYDGDNYFWVNDFNPTMIMHPLKPQLDGNSLVNSKDPDGTRLFVEMVNVVKKQGEGFVPYKWPKPGAQTPVDKISFVKGFTPWQWIIGSGVYLDTIDAAFSELRWLMIIDVVVIIIILAVLSSVISNSVLHPIRLAADMMKDISQGQGDLTQQLDEHGNDEISRLSRYFNSYTEKMRHSIAQVSENTRHVEQFANQVDDAGKVNLTHIEQQDDNSRQVATAVEQMSTQIQAVSENAHAAEIAAKDALQNSEQGKLVIANTITAIQTLSSNIQSVSKVSAILATESNNIGSVLDVIRGISEQTNLLALNAAIEAARAGEQGRGFAVVADEVRTLASRTGQSTDEIQKMIEKLQKNAQETVNAVQSCQEISENTVAQASGADQVLDEIERLITVISDMNSHIARATQEQSSVAQEVNLRITDLSNATQQSLDTTQTLTDASLNLKQSSHQLGQVVQRFKI